MTSTPVLPSQSITTTPPFQLVTLADAAVEKGTSTNGMAGQPPFTFAYVSDTHLYVRTLNKRFVRAAVKAVSALIMVTENGVRLFPVHLRYAWPSELDLMARLAGMKLRARYGGWNRQPFDDNSQIHVSVYELQPKLSPSNRGKPQNSKSTRMIRLLSALGALWLLTA